MKCEARIVREYKTRKAECVWPETVYGPVPQHAEQWPEVCGGDVTVVVRAASEPAWGGTLASLEAEWTCSRCRAPYVPGRFAFDGAVANGSVDVTAAIERLRELQVVS